METLDPMSTQSGISGFLNNTDQAAQISSLVEDIRDAIMHYQVCYVHIFRHQIHSLHLPQTSLQQDINENTLTILQLSHELSHQSQESGMCIHATHRRPY